MSAENIKLIQDAYMPGVCLKYSIAKGSGETQEISPLFVARHVKG